MANRARGKRRAPGRQDDRPVAYKPPTLRERVKDHADSAARSLMEEHPLHKRMKGDMRRAIMGVVKNHTGSARGPSPRMRGGRMFE